MGTGPGQIVNEADWTYVAARTYTKDIGRITRPTSQALADNTQVAINFTNEDYDTGGHHSTVTNTTRITPTRAGYYLFRGQAAFSGLTTPVLQDATFRKNGTDQMPGASRITGQTATTVLTCFTMIDMNGTTDYMEFVMRQDSAGSNNTNTTSPFIPVVEWEFVRDL